MILAVLVKLILLGHTLNIQASEPVYFVQVAFENSGVDSVTVDSLAGPGWFPLVTNPAAPHNTFIAQTLRLYAVSVNGAFFNVYGRTEGVDATCYPDLGGLFLTRVGGETAAGQPWEETCDIIVENPVTGVDVPLVDPVTAPWATIKRLYR